MDSNSYSADPVDMTVADERDLPTARIFALLGIASAMFWGGVGLVLYAIA